MSPQPAVLVRTHLVALLPLTSDTPGCQDSHFPSPPHPAPGSWGLPSGAISQASLWSPTPTTHQGLVGLCVGPLHVPLCVLQATTSTHHQPRPSSMALGPPPFCTSPCGCCTNSQTQHVPSRTPHLPIFVGVKNTTPLARLPFAQSSAGLGAGEGSGGRTAPNT